MYTYGHTLSLHDALPIYQRHAPSPLSAPWVHPGQAARQWPGARYHRVQGRGQGSPQAGWHSGDSSGQPREAEGHKQLRSEEHTSELQSLMRISYAVFRLNKKRTTHFIHTLTQQQI